MYLVYLLEKARLQPHILLCTHTSTYIRVPNGTKLDKTQLVLDINSPEESELSHWVLGPHSLPFLAFFIL